MKKVLLAVGEGNLSSLLRSEFTEASGTKQQFDVLYDEVLHRRFIQSMTLQYRPDYLVIHDQFLPSNYAISGERDEEVLTIIKELRMNDIDIRIVYICNRSEKDPFLGKVVGLGVYDIFHQQQFSTTTFIGQLSEPIKFANVAKFGVGAVELDLPTVEIRDNEQVVSVPDEDRQQRKPIIGSIIQKLTKKQLTEGAITDLSEGTGDIEPIKTPMPTEEEKEQHTTVTIKENEVPPVELNPDSNNTETTNERELDEKLKIQVEDNIDPLVKFKPQTVVLAVAGLTGNSGVTSVAISLAMYFSSAKKKVAVIELNQTLGFERLHAYKEHRMGVIHDADHFEFKGIDHYKFSVGRSIADIVNRYDYVVLDMGVFSDMHPYLQEFKRATCRYVCVPNAEWKWYTVDRLNKQDPYALEDYHFLFVQGNEQISNSFKEIYNVQNASFYEFPQQLYSLEPNEAEQVKNLLSYYVVDAPVKSKHWWVLVSAASLVIAGLGGYLYLI
ncbi:hypothetical protein LAV72_18660 [Lysinibacillus xylanilyticus]|uniref:hypothetical protein n=1 Tax=Lysinibacillus xylanilyticus TaxID=582475 RepID=UPI002B2560D7|nr:hypothetical protein [Lysinibacillus xylanilyticus]MEB2301629.1 hypothetical protein [Lysinibacillus xylanilyticus]